MKNSFFDFKFIYIAALTLLFNALAGYAAIYFVSKYGNNSNPGTKLLPRLTINSGVSLLSGGDTLYIRTGIYEEKLFDVIPSGTVETYTTISGYPGEARPILRKIYIRNNSYIKLLNLEITHGDGYDTNGIELYARGSDVVRYITVQNCYIHEIYGTGVKGIIGVGQSNWIFRGNELYYMGHPSQSARQNGSLGFNISDTNGGYYLVEYNKVVRAGDFCNILAKNVIVRNNYMKDFRNSYWPAGSGDSLHADFFQPGGVAKNPASNQIYESNVFGENWELNSHLYHFQSTFSGDYGRIIRGNIIYDIASGIGGCYGIDSVTHYNNTYYNASILTTYSGGTIGFWVTAGNYSLGNKVFNSSFSVYSGGTRTGWPFQIDVGSECTGSNNTCYLYSGESCVASDWQSYADTTNHIFTIPNTSINKDAGRALTTITTASGSGTTFAVADRWLFCDGYNMTRGDSIYIGASEKALITGVSGLDITTAATVTWAQGDSIWWRATDRKTDVGAYEYRADYTYGIELTNGSTVDTGNIALAATVTNADNVRMVEFYVNNLPQPIDYSPPFSVTWRNNTSNGDTVYITAVAYPLYADSLVSKSDTVIAITRSKTGREKKIGIWYH